MKKFTLLLVTFVMAILAFTGCELNSTNNVNTVTVSSREEETLCSEAVEHYEQLFKDSWLFAEDSEVKIVPLSDTSFGVLEEKSDGTSVTYTLEGDIAGYMVPAILGTDNYYLQHRWTKVYNYRFQMIPESNTIIGDLIVDTETIIEEQDENGLAYLKEVMLQNGIPKADFSYENMKIYYGDKEVTGLFKDIIIDMMYGFPDIIRCYTNIEVSEDDYTIRIETYGSPDGIYYGLNSSDSIEVDLTIINSIYGIKITTPDEYKIIQKDTGLNQNNQNLLKGNVEYSSGLSQPIITVSLERRKYDSVYDQNYEVVDLANYVTDSLTKFNFENENSDKLEYLFSDKPTANMDFTYAIKQNLTTGTYRLTFKLYDVKNIDNQNRYEFIGDAYEYIIIK